MNAIINRATRQLRHKSADRSDDPLVAAAAQAQARVGLIKRDMDLAIRTREQENRQFAHNAVHRKCVRVCGVIVWTL